MRTRLLVASALVGAPGVAVGQVVRARAIDEASKAAVAGALISLRTPAGARVAQTLTDEGGRATLKAPAAGSYLIRGDRIGFEGSTTAPLQLGAADTVSITITMPARRVMLPELSVSGGKPVCRIEQESGNQMATVWEEARKALTGTVLTRTARPPVLEITTFERDLDHKGLIKSERSSTRRQAGSQPFAAADPARLIEKGFVEQKDGEVWYYGPDASLLLSDPFLAVHCFKLVRQKDDTSLVGLAFEPARGRKVPEVKGTLWLNRSTAELKSLEFSFVNVDKYVASGREGGQVGFVRLPNGAWIIDDWSIRMPMVARYRRIGDSEFAGRDSVIGVRESGGRAALVDVGATVARNRAVVEGVVYDSIRGEPLESAVVTIGGGGYVDTTDQSGRYRIETPTQGSFVVTFSHPRFELLGLAPRTGSASLERGKVATLHTAIPPIERIRPALCTGVQVDAEVETTLLGFIRDSLGRPLPRARVDLSWREYSRAGSAIAEARRTAQAAADENGAYRVCGLPPERIVVHAPAGVVAEPASIRLQADSVAVYDLTLVPRDRIPARSAARVTVLAAGTGKPVPGALVWAGADTVRAGEDGVALVGPFRPGLVSYQAKALGFNAGKGQVTVGDRDTAAASLHLDPVAVALRDLEVRGEKRAGARMVGFVERSQTGLGHYFTREKLAEREHSLLTDVLRMSAGINMVPRVPCSGTAAASGRDRSVGRLFSCNGRAMMRACYLAVYFDGMLMWDWNTPSPPPSLDDWAVRELGGVEVYIGLPQVPAQYQTSGANCGAVLLWTRDS